MRKIADDSEDEFVEEEKKKEKDGVIAVKDDPQFTLAITRGIGNKNRIYNRMQKYTCDTSHIYITSYLVCYS